MAINFSNSKEISESAVNKLYAQGHIVQCVQTTNNGNVTMTAGTQASIHSLSITTSVATNKVLVYMFVTERMDPPSNTWAIFFNKLFYTGPSGASGTGTNIIHSGWNGTYRFYLGNYEKYYLHSPGVAGTHTYEVVVNTYPAGTGYVNSSTNQGGSGLGIIRLMEVAA